MFRHCSQKYSSTYQESFFDGGDKSIPGPGCNSPQRWDKIDNPEWSIGLSEDRNSFTEPFRAQYPSPQDYKPHFSSIQVFVSSLRTTQQSTLSLKPVSTRNQSNSTTTFTIPISERSPSKTQSIASAILQKTTLRLKFQESDLTNLKPTHPTSISKSTIRKDSTLVWNRRKTFAFRRRRAVPRAWKVPQNRPGSNIEVQLPQEYEDDI